MRTVTGLNIWPHILDDSFISFSVVNSMASEMLFWNSNLSDSTSKRSSIMLIRLSVSRQFHCLAASCKAVLFDVEDLKLNSLFESIDRG